MDVTVVGLGAWCDIDEEPAGSTPPPGGAGHAADTTGNVLRFRVEEFATLSDGRRLTLTDDRGWGSVASGRPAAEPWAGLTVEAVEAEVRNVVLPDDAEETGDQHAWALLADRLRALGVETVPKALRHLPYEVTLSPRLRARLPARE